MMTWSIYRFLFIPKDHPNVFFYPTIKAQHTGFIYSHEIIAES